MAHETLPLLFLADRCESSHQVSIFLVIDARLVIGDTGSICDLKFQFCSSPCISKVCVQRLWKCSNLCRKLGKCDQLSSVFDVDFLVFHLQNGRMGGFLKASLEKIFRLWCQSLLSVQDEYCYFQCSSMIALTDFCL